MVERYFKSLVHVTGLAPPCKNLSSPFRSRSHRNVSMAPIPTQFPWRAARNDVPPSGLGKPGAGSTGAGQGSRYARPAPPAGGLDWHRLARRVSAMRRWLGASDMPLLARLGGEQTCAVLWFESPLPRGAMAHQKSRPRRTRSPGLLPDEKIPCIAIAIAVYAFALADPWCGAIAFSSRGLQ